MTEMKTKGLLLGAYYNVPRYKHEFRWEKYNRVGQTAEYQFLQEKEHYPYRLSGGSTYLVPCGILTGYDSLKLKAVLKFHLFKI